MSEKIDAVQQRGRGAGLFDLRYIIALLFGIYGAVCTVLGLVSHTAADDAKTGGININLWSGVGMLIFAAAMGGWAMLRPVRIEATVSPDEMG